MLLTGEIEELSLASRIKANVDHAGLSHQLVPLKVVMHLLLANFSAFLSNNSSIATWTISVAVEAGWIKLSHTLIKTHLKKKTAIPTKLPVMAADTTVAVEE